MIFTETSLKDINNVYFFYFGKYIVYNHKRSVIKVPNNIDDKNVNIERTNVSRNEQPSMVGSTFIKYAAYIVILLIVLYFLVRFVFPMI